MTRSIYLFHMPLFMTLSGIFYGMKVKKYTIDIQCFILNKVRRLLIPYITTSLILAPILLYIKPSSDTGLFVEIIDNAFLFKDTRHLWFILALFQIFAIQILFDKYKIPIFATFIFSLSIGIIYKVCFQGYAEFACFHMALQYWPYFVFGNIVIKKEYIGHINILIPCGLLPILLIVRHISSIELIRSICEYTIAIIIVSGLLFSADRINTDKTSKLFKQIILLISDMSFSIYLFHIPVLFFFHQLSLNCHIHIMIILICLLIFSIIIPLIMGYSCRKMRCEFMIGELNGRIRALSV